MRKIIVTEFITLDGVVEAPGGKETEHPHRGWQWQYSHAETGKYKVDELAAADALLLGKGTYEMFAGFWPNQPEGPFATQINRLPKYVVSRSLQNADWNNSLILRDVENEVAALKNTDGGNILVYGSATLAKALLHYNLIDELHLLLYPITVGGGLRIFDDNFELNKFNLKHSQAFDNGAVLLEYEPVN